MLSLFISNSDCMKRVEKVFSDNQERQKFEVLSFGSIRVATSELFALEDRKHLHRLMFVLS